MVAQTVNINYAEILATDIFSISHILSMLKP